MDKNASVAFSEIQIANGYVPKPQFVTFNRNILMLCRQNITDTDAQGISEYIKSMTKCGEDKKIFKINIDSCNLTDFNFSLVLDSVYK